MQTAPPVSCSVFIATSLDGYIARADGNIDWLERANATVPAGEDCGYASFMRSVDAIVMGLNTFEKAVSFPEWPYPTTPVWVMSQSMESLPVVQAQEVRLMRGSPHDVVAQAQARGFRRVYVDGGQLIQSFLRAQLLTDITVTTVPVLIGDGRRLFGSVDEDVDLALRNSTRYPFGFVQSCYEPRYREALHPCRHFSDPVDSTDHPPP